MNSPTGAPHLRRGQLIDQLRKNFQIALAIRQKAAGTPILAEQRKILRHWQAQRLARSYADLLALPKFALAASFFLSELYPAHDLSSRDRELERALPSLAKLLPQQALAALNSAIAADALSEQLDAALALRLFAPGAETKKPRNGESSEISLSQYGQAFRDCNNQPTRNQQLALVIETGKTLDGIAGSRLLSAAIQMMRGPARASGLVELQAFLERGMSAFQALGGATEFLAIVAHREAAVIDGLFSGATDPFALP